MATASKKEPLRWDNSSLVEEVVWDMRLADLPRAENRDILNKLFNGDPPFDPAKAEENNIEINVNDLKGPTALAAARRQWNGAFLPPGNLFSVTLDCGPAHKRADWSQTITREINRALKEQPRKIEETRSTGGNTVLHGIAPSNWANRRTPIPVPLPVGSLLIPSETDTDFGNLDYFAVFREWTVAQVYKMVSGPTRDPGWDMDLINANLAYLKTQNQKQPNSTAYQYMPERITELRKQDIGFWASDAVPTLDVWDFYFREGQDGDGWYRRIIPDWGISAEAMPSYAKAGKPERPFSSPNKDTENNWFLYSSGHRKYANSLREIIHCQFGDCSAVFPSKYHSVRSLGWLLWAVCDLQNRLHCRFQESVFESLLWFFRTASNADLVRLKKANFAHMGVIPQGISFVTAAERFVPPLPLIQLAFARNQESISENSAAFTQDFLKSDSGKEMSATETMARLNQVNAMVTEFLALGYTYEEFKDREDCRRFCIKNNPVPMVKEFQKRCLEQGVPAKGLDVERWIVRRERAIGGGNQTLAMAEVQFLQSLRKNLSPTAQRQVDHISIVTATHRADLANDLAPLGGEKHVSASMNNAELATERILRGLKYSLPKDAVAEDYVLVWLRDLSEVIQKATAAGNMATPDQVNGFANLGWHINTLLDQLEEDPESKQKVTAYKKALGKLENSIKGFVTRLQQAAKAQAPQGGQVDGKDQAKIQATIIGAQTKAKLSEQRSAQRMAMDQARFEADQARQEREHNAELRREDLAAGHELETNRLKGLIDQTQASYSE